MKELASNGGAVGHMTRVAVWAMEMEEASRMMRVSTYLRENRRMIVMMRQMIEMQRPIFDTICSGRFSDWETKKQQQITIFSGWDTSPSGQLSNQDSSLIRTAL